MSADARVVEPGPDRSPRRSHALHAPVEHTFLPELRTPERAARLTLRLVGRIEGGIEHFEPTVDRFVTTNRRYQQVACPSRRNVGEPHRLCLVAEELLVGGLEEFNGRASTQRLYPQPP